MVRDLRIQSIVHMVDLKNCDRDMKVHLNFAVLKSITFFLNNRATVVSCMSKLIQAHQSDT